MAALASFLFAPHTVWAQYFKEIGASALYVQNWVLSADAVDYLAAQNTPSPVQHFWSLSAEEQFYLIWPVAIVLSALVGARSRSWNRRRAVLAVFVLLTLASFVVSIVWTSKDASAAYFVTPTRMWEFGCGGLLALAPAMTTSQLSRTSALTSWIGLFVIGASALFYSNATVFPGSGSSLGYRRRYLSRHYRRRLE